jgi:hypothetical protein
MKPEQAISHIFISSSRQDAELARDIARRLRAAGFVPWLDSTVLGGGEDWNSILRDRLRDAAAVFMLLTPAALDSPWMMRELGMAEAFDKTVIPVVAGLTPERLPEPLQSYQVVPFDQLDEAIDGLTQRLAQAHR